jgi:protease I
VGLKGDPIVSEQARSLGGKKIAILVTDGFEQVEMVKPREAFDQAGATTTLVAPRSGSVQGWNHDEKGTKFPVDLVLDQADAAQFDALLLPGGVMNPDQLRQNPAAVSFVKAFATAGKPIAAICHGPWTLIEADAVRGRKMTSWPSLKTDLQNAGANWVDQQVVTDRGLVTSRKPDDIPAFVKKAIEEFTEPQHQPRPTAGLR